MLKEKERPQKLHDDQQHMRDLGLLIFSRHRNFYVYVFWGFLAAMLNTFIFIGLHSWGKMALIYANTIAFALANLFSFWANKHTVFVHNVDHYHSIWYQLGLFFLYRLLSLIPDNLIMIVGLSWLHWHIFIVKVLDQTAVGIFNYLTTRSIFQKSNRDWRRYHHKYWHDDKNTK